MTAVVGERPVRKTFLPFATPAISQAMIDEVVDTLRSGWLATGPKTERFEERFALRVASRFALGTTCGSMSLLLALDAAGIGDGDEVITTPLTFVATTNAVLHRRAVPVLADIDPATWNLDPAEVERRITPRTRAILPVHFAGRPCDMTRLSEIAKRHGLVIISDSAHSIESEHARLPLAKWAAINAFSFHPIKNLTTAEGGMITTDRKDWAQRLRHLRLHGVTSDAFHRHTGRAPAGYDLIEPGYKCNMSDVQASIGLHQLSALDSNLARRELISKIYDDGLSDIDELQLPARVPEGDRHARHLYNVLVRSRVRVCEALRAENVGTGHHYPALHRTSFFRERFGTSDTDYPVATSVSERIVSLPLFPTMTDDDAHSVVEALRKVLAR